MQLAHNPSARRGSALVLSLIAIVTLAALGAVFLRITTSLTSRQTDDVENMKAFYLAEAGLAEAFQAVRIGRTGQVGSEAAPAGYGDGLVWVDATTTADAQVRLESTAMVGRGRASLSYVVEPVEVPLGFFGEEELVVESVLMVDGWDSTEGAYSEFAESGLKDYADWLHGEIGTGHFDSLVGPLKLSSETLTLPGNVAALLTFEQELELLGWLLALRAGYPAGYDPDGPVEGTAVASAGDTSAHTVGGGLLGSNADIRFLAASGEPVTVYGDIEAGPSGTIHGLDAATVSGETGPRAQAVELPSVQVPAVSLAAPVRHADLLPLLVPAGSAGYERIEVAADAELILQGPSTVVIGTLILEPGATLSLDTRDGDVALYVTEEMELQPGSLVSTSEDPKEASIQVPEIPNGLDGAPIRLDATAQFHGTIYAPLTEVRIGGDFEVFGGVIARRLEIGAGARLHFDSAGFDGSPIPRIVSWRFVEIPSTVRGVRDPFARIGLTADELEPLAAAHDLASVEMVLTYLDHGGTLRTYTGSEDLFDWFTVGKVVQVDRNPDRKDEVDDGSSTPDEPTTPLTPEEEILLDLVNDPYVKSRDLRDQLIADSPLSERVLLAALAREPVMNSNHLFDVLQASGPATADVPTGTGTGPLPDSVLGDCITAALGSDEIGAVLVQNSPLSDAVLQAAIDRDPVMHAEDLDAVLAAQ